MRLSSRFAVVPALGLAISLGLAACSGSPDVPPLYGSSGTGGSGPINPVSAADQSFLLQAAYGGLGEVQVAGLAVASATSPEIRDFARQMQTDHGRTNERLRALAGARGITLPVEPDPGRQAVATALSGVTGLEFDRQYVAHQRLEHELAIGLFEGAVRTSRDDELRALAAEALPLLRAHLERVRALGSALISQAG